MKPFTKNEIIVVSLILLAVFVVSFFNFKTSLRRARDAQRREDLGLIANALDKYQKELGFFPPSQDGKIKACKGENFDEVMQKIDAFERFDQEIFFEGLRVCEWGKDPLVNLLDAKSSPYLSTIPGDPKTNLGFSYFYLSNSKRYQLFSYLEGEGAETGYDERVVDRNLSCGIKICSFGRAYGATPIEKSIEDYEKELLEKSKSGGN